MSIPIYRRLFQPGEVLQSLRAKQYTGERSCMTIHQLVDSTERQCSAPAVWEVEWQEHDGTGGWLYCCEPCFADTWRPTFIVGWAQRLRVLGCVQCGKPAEHCVIVLADGDVVIDELDGPCNIDATKYAPMCQACLDAVYAQVKEEENSEKGIGMSLRSASNGPITTGEN
jgi:hypothetical protein